MRARWQQTQHLIAVGGRGGEVLVDVDGELDDLRARLRVDGAAGLDVGGEFTEALFVARERRGQWWG